MGELIVSEFVTLDGVVEAPGGEPTHPHAGWVGDYMTPEQLEYKSREVHEGESLLIGRVTYEGFAAAWPERDGEFADKMNGMPKYVVSSTLAEPLAWNNSSVLRGDLVTEVSRLKDTTTGPILVAGSATLVAFLLDNDLVDELRLMVFPVMIGGGKRCFPETMRKHPFAAGEHTTFPSGVTVTSYRPRR